MNQRQNEQDGAEENKDRVQPTGSTQPGGKGPMAGQQYQGDQYSGIGLMPPSGSVQTGTQGGEDTNGPAGGSTAQPSNKRPEEGKEAESNRNRQS